MYPLIQLNIYEFTSVQHLWVYFDQSDSLTKYVIQTLMWILGVIEPCRIFPYIKTERQDRIMLWQHYPPCMWWDTLSLKVSEATVNDPSILNETTVYTNCWSITFKCQELILIEQIGHTRHNILSHLWATGVWNNSWIRNHHITSTCESCHRSYTALQ